MLRRALGLACAATAGLVLAVVAFGAPPSSGTGPPTWVPGPPPCHGHSACPPPSTSTVTNATTTTVARTSTSTTTVATTTTVAKTTTVDSTTTVGHTSTVSTTETMDETSTLVFGVPGSSSGPPGGADIWLAVKAPAGRVFAGSPATYLVTITDAGPSPATGVHLGVVPAGSRVLSSASSDLGELDAGASTTVSVTLAPNGPGTMAATFIARADQPDPQPGNNIYVASSPVLAGHAGPPGLQTPSQGAFKPPLFAVRSGHTWVVSTKVHVDEPAAVTVRVLDGSGRPQTMLPGSLVDYLPANRPHSSIPHVLDAAAWMPLKLRIDGPSGRGLRIVVQAIGPDGSVSSITIGFRTR